MLCRKPYMGGAVPHACGQCLPCRINRRRLWTWRCFLESLTHEENCFVTLTYANETLPKGGELVPRDVQLFLKRFRKAIAPSKVRFFAVGEYGDHTFRPHYHLSLFGVGQAHAPIIQEAWGKGITATFEFNETTAQYVCGYVVKKMTGADDERLAGRHPEFARMSVRPGIGASAMSVVAEQLLSDAGLDEFAKTGDVPYQLKIGRRSIPLGRYLRKKLREEIGMPEHLQEEVKNRFTLERSEEINVLHLRARAAGDTSPYTTRTLLDRENLGRIRSVEARSKLRSRRTL